MRHANPTVGILLTATRDDVVVEYALQGVAEPMAAVTYHALPEPLRARLPSPAALMGVLASESGESAAPP